MCQDEFEDENFKMKHGLWKLMSSNISINCNKQVKLCIQKYYFHVLIFVIVIDVEILQ